MASRPRGAVRSCTSLLGPLGEHHGTSLVRQQNASAVGDVAYGSWSWGGAGKPLLRVRQCELDRCQSKVAACRPEPGFPDLVGVVAHLVDEPVEPVAHVGGHR